jgi:hypothetical protein
VTDNVDSLTIFFFLQSFLLNLDRDQLSGKLVRFPTNKLERFFSCPIFSPSSLSSGANLIKLFTAVSYDFS